MSEGDIGLADQGAPRPDAVGQATDDPCEDPEPPSGPSGVDDLPDLTVVAEAGDWSAFPDAEGAVHGAAVALARYPEGRELVGREATVVLGDDALVRSLNRTYRAQDKPTNVLSFPFSAPAGAPKAAALCLGDVILAAETLQREAADLGILPVHHLQHLVIHGLLHLLGHDHLKDAEAQRMEAIETAVLAGLGIADPYAA